MPNGWKLVADPSNQSDFLSEINASVTVKVTALGRASFVWARFNGNNLPVQNENTVSFTVNRGRNTLELVVAAANPNDTVQILEDYGGGRTQILRQYQNDPSNPVTEFTIFGS